MPGEGVGMPGDQADRAEPTAARRLSRLNAVASVSFILGGSLFALGAYFAEMGNVSLTTVNVTYLAGGFFFSLGGYTSVLMASNDTVGAPMPPQDMISPSSGRSSRSTRSTGPHSRIACVQASTLT